MRPWDQEAARHNQQSPRILGAVYLEPLLVTSLFPDGGPESMM